MNEPNDTETNNVELRNALRRLRDSAAGERASDPLEANLLQAFRAHNARKPELIRKWAWVSAAIAASLMAAVAWRVSTPAVVYTPPQPVIAAVAPKATEAKAVPPPVTRAKAAVRPRPRKPVGARPRQAQQPPEMFVEIPYAPEFNAYDGGQVVRVNMPAASVRRIGLQVTADRVQADVLFGNDGIARAIRLVSNSGLNPER